MRIATGGRGNETASAFHIAPAIAAHLVKTIPADERRNRVFVLGALRVVPSRLHGAIVAAYSDTARMAGGGDAGDIAANLALLDTRDAFRAGRLDLAASDSDIVAAATERAEEVAGHLSRLTLSTAEVVAAWCARFAKHCGVALPRCKELRGVVGRMTEAAWWRRALRRSIVREVEKQCVRLGMVHRRASVYASVEAIARRAEQRRRNARIMAGLEAVNEDGEILDMSELVAGSVSNPQIRRMELMTRVAGFERCAAASGHVGVFYTVTCPSRMHARLSPSGAANPKYDKTTPRKAQAYLSKTWARVRARLARLGVGVYGFRVAEPHHDATPHWHMVLFMEGAARDAVDAAMLDYFCEADAGELSTWAARSVRVNAKAIDGRGAAGYIAKYISKNIDAAGVGEDLETGGDASDSVAAVDAWAATWGIRQFQQIGGAGVTIWRELRRLDGAQGELFAPAWAAADAGDWQGYTDAMGGALAARKARPLALWRALAQSVNRYGEECAGRVAGVCAGVVSLCTRVHTWTIRKKPKTMHAPGVARTRVNNCTDAPGRAARENSGGGRGGGRQRGKSQNREAELLSL